MAIMDAAPGKCLSPTQGPGKKHWTEPAVLTVNSALHKVALCRNQQWALQVQSSRHSTWLLEHHISYLKALKGERGSVEPAYLWHKVPTLAWSQGMQY